MSVSINTLISNLRGKMTASWLLTGHCSEIPRDPMVATVRVPNFSTPLSTQG